MEVHPWKLTCPLKSDHFRGVANFQTRDLHCIPLDPWNDGIFTDPWMLDFFMVNVGRYTSPMDLMGLGIIENFKYVNQPLIWIPQNATGSFFLFTLVRRRVPAWSTLGWQGWEILARSHQHYNLCYITSRCFQWCFLVCTGFWGRCPIWLLFRWTLMSNINLCGRFFQPIRRSFHV